MAHDGAAPPDALTLVRLLRTIRDVLLLLDYRSGRDWAMSYIEFPHGEDIQLVGPEPVFEAPFPID